MQINKKRAIRFLQKLIQENTVNPPGNELGVAQIIKEHVQNYNLNAEIKTITNDRANIIVQLPGENPDSSPLIYSGHLDTVPIGETTNWHIDPFLGEIKNGKLYGRGACDMKSGVAALIESMIYMKENNITPKEDIIFIGTVGEEVDCLGAKQIIQENLIDNAGAMIIAEPSNNKVFSAHKGALWLEIETLGKTAHGATPKEGINAIRSMMNILKKLENASFLTEFEHHLLGKPSINVSMVEGGVQANVVPDYCKSTVDIRTVPTMEHNMIIERVNSLLKEEERNGCRAKLNILQNLMPLSNKENNPFVNLALHINENIQGKKFKEGAANYYTDGSVFADYLDIPIIIYGPGDGKLAHQANEYVETENYINSINYYILMAQSYTQA